MHKTFVVKQRSAFGTKSFFGTDCSVEHYHSPKEKQRGAVCGDDGQMFQSRFVNLALRALFPRRRLEQYLRSSKTRAAELSFVAPCFYSAPAAFIHPCH
jgi:hypothetical protein